MLGLVVFAVTLMLAIKLYKKSRVKKEVENGERRTEENDSIKKN
jgi:hypothetical protein